MPTRIEWCEETWSPVTGCTKVSTGCENCFAESMAKRLRGRYGYPADEPFRPTYHPDRLDIPLHWRKPRRIFVCSMGDLFHPHISYNFVESIWDTMFNSPQHIYQILTKRPERMLEFTETMSRYRNRRTDYENVWLGVSVEDQETADERIPILLNIPAAVRFVSFEPLLGPIEFQFGWLESGPGASLQRDQKGWTGPIDWVIVGGESGPNARPMHPAWPLSIRDQCQEAGTPYFFKGWGSWSPIVYKGSNRIRAVCLTPNRGEILLHKPWRINMKRMNKKAAGRKLNGRTWDEYPESRR